MKFLFQRIGLWVSTGLGAGYFPKFPGTVGTLWGLLLFFGMKDLPPLHFLGVTCILILLSVLAVVGAMATLGPVDSPHVVIDEVVGYLVSVLWIPFSWPVAGMAFVLFRIFDILKPFPIRWLDRNIKGAWGVVIDDVAAGIAANLVLRLILHFWWQG